MTFGHTGISWRRKGKTGVRPDVVASQIFIYGPILFQIGGK